MNIALILAGGVGTRLGADIPKQFIQVQNRPIIAYSLNTFEQHDRIDRIQVVADEAWRGFIGQYSHEKLAGFSSPGINRQLSIFNGLEDILSYAQPEDCVIIHDSARPNISMKLISDILDALELHEAVIPVLTMKDTLYRLVDGHLSGGVDRDTIVSGQAPEGFRLGVYFDAVKDLLPDKILSITGSLQPALDAGLDCASVPGDEHNYKITMQEDLNKFISELNLEKKRL